ncbi:MAG: hypothetical protein EA356_01345 [Geminicoccaceae bacterium]|nr:MAG: hypothetical protein EA356_01345 [Geminicoccaceae bacterium]
MKGTRTTIGKLGSLIHRGFDPNDVAIIATRVMADIDCEDLAYLAGPVVHCPGEPPDWLVAQARAQRYRVIGGDLRDFPCTAEEIVLVLGWEKRIEIGHGGEADLLLWAREIAERHRRDLPCGELERSPDVVAAGGPLNEVFWNYGGTVRQLVQDGGAAQAERLGVGRSTTRCLM